MSPESPFPSQAPSPPGAGPALHAADPTLPPELTRTAPLPPVDAPPSVETNRMAPVDFVAGDQTQIRAERMAAKEAAKAAGEPKPERPKKQHRTTGLKLFDVFLYPFLTNFVVFAISVWATYMTSHGDKLNTNSKFYNKLGDAIHKRGEWLMDVFEHKLGMKNKETREMSKMVFFSFADGTLVAPMVKLLEDRREKIAMKIDTALGTKPEDEQAAYAAEPKQSWWSVIGGRLAVASIIVPIAATLEKVGLKDGKLATKGTAGAGFVSFNDRMFTRTSERMGNWFERNPGVARLFGKHTEMRGLSKTLVFEAFYTSVCTAGLYVSSRFIANFSSKRKQAKLDAEAAPASGSTASTTAPVNREAASIQPTQPLGNGLSTGLSLEPTEQELAALNDGVKANIQAVQRVRAEPKLKDRPSLERTTKRAEKPDTKPAEWSQRVHETDGLSASFAKA